ncbi:hypothetical protein SAMN05421810_101247 [Amycolatopsis arida]|uniref:Uncharacterized protein n=1 Tax=Amycolatopsis arida TaxID=587909 RepID=A0A1I5KP87_9PSEU|nr:hypothetical protein [Amycolatopsis arida]TDX97142.1 hypothetical protein CLV69_102245 [Amycolatopsis arida]SFO86909.1 hypothetical protein SAMN05421810_101247 [Amycolatopsis arida]
MDAREAELVTGERIGDAGAALRAGRTLLRGARSPAGPSLVAIDVAGEATSVRRAGGRPALTRAALDAHLAQLPG